MTDDHATQGTGVTSLITGGTGFTDSHLETGDPAVAAADIPVFCDHNALAMSLEKDLGFLCDNGYTTLFAREVVDILRGRNHAAATRGRLTFDDALLSVLDVGLPLFDRYDVKAPTVFAIAGLTPHGTVAAAGGKRDTYCLLGSDDLRKLRDSGLVELGSHGHRHNPVRVGTEAGTPISLARYSRLHDAPIEYGDGYDEAAIRAADGTPRCRRSRCDLDRSIAALREHLGNERAHLCLSYGAGIDAIPELAEAAGFESVFWTQRQDRQANRLGADPRRIVRRKCDFVRRLPGRGRRSLVGLLAHKVVRRLTSNPFI